MPNRGRGDRPMPCRHRITGWIFRPLAAALVAAGLSACAGQGELPSGQPSFYRSLAGPGVELDAAAAQSMISGYRQNNGLTALTIDPELMRLADEQARLMAARDKL